MSRLDQTCLLKPLVDTRGDFGTDADVFGKGMGDKPQREEDPGESFHVADATL
jgi:hypothetical protein